MLSELDAQKFIETLSKISFPAPSNVFDSICENLITCPVELAVVREGEEELEILLLKRDKDKYFDGTTWHMPGSIILPGRTASVAMKLLIEREIGVLHELPKFIGIYDILKGDSFGMCVRGQEVSRFYMVRTTDKDSIPLSDVKKFFPLSSIQDEMLLTNHQLYVCDLREYVKRNRT